MAKIILLTGVPGSGKTTAIKRILSRLTTKVGGFYTQEVRAGGVRMGFKIVTLDGQEGILAHVEIEGQPRISKYGVNLAAIESIAVASLKRAEQQASVIILDEIGPMEILSEEFCRTVMDLLESEVSVVGSIVQRRLPFADKVKSHPAVTLLEITPSNRHRIVDQVLELLEDTVPESREDRES
jgi:nucleoside-triphosphatase